MARAKKTVETATIIPEKAKEAAKPVKVKATKAQKKSDQRGMSISAYERKHVGEEPKWDTARAKKMDDAEFSRHLMLSLNYYTYFYTSKDLKKLAVAWAQENMKLSNEDLSLYVMSDSELTPLAVCSLIKAMAVGMPLREKNKAYMIDKIKHAIEVTRKEPAVIAKVEKKETYTPTIQDRLAEKTAAIVGEIEGQVDNVFANKETSDIYDFITKENLPQAQVGKVRSHFQKQIDEISLVVDGGDKQLSEAYSFLSNKDLKRLVAFYVKLMADLDSYTAVKKASKKARLKKAPSKDKLVAKMKYMKEDKALKLVSIPSSEVIGAQTLWVFDTKARKLMRYVADSMAGGLSVKGTTIVGFDVTKSVAKTLRKPEEQLKEFMKASKVDLRKFMENIKAVEIKANGRMNDRQILLKVV